MLRPFVIALSLGLAASPMRAATLIDDFTQTSNEGLFPVSTDLPNFGVVSDPFRDLNGVVANRLVTISFESPFGAGFEADLDVASGELTYTQPSSGLGALFTLTYSTAFNASVENNGFNLDVQEQSALRVGYRVSTAVTLGLSLGSGGGGLGLTQGNSTLVELLPDASFIDIPLSTITGSAVGPFAAPVFEVGGGEILDDVDLSDVDGLAFVVDTRGGFISDDAGFSLTFTEIAFVPEPASASVLVIGGVVSLMRRRSA